MAHPTHECPAHDSKLYFDRLSEKWELKYSANGSMTRRLTGIAELVRDWVPSGGRILDFGCGTGDISARCEDSGFKIDAVDRSPKMIERAKSRFESQKIQFTTCSDPLQLPFSDETFDGIVVSSVLEYVVSLEAQLVELRRISKAGGHILLTVPNMSHPIRWIEAFEKLAVVPFRNLAPGAYRERGEYLALSVNRFNLPRWKQHLWRVGWNVLSILQRHSPLLLIVAERRAVDERNHTGSI